MRLAVTETLRICHPLSIQQMFRSVLLTGEIHDETLTQAYQVRVVHVPLVLYVNAFKFVTLQRPGNLL